MCMRRLVEQKLIDWKNSEDRKPLIIYGARQIGKTYSMLDFGNHYYDNVVYCNFEAGAELHKIFDVDFNVERIIASLSALYGVKINRETTLIIFDEIQACEKALTSLKYFCENAPKYHIMAAGSLLGLAVNRGHFSFPVGKVDMITMYPLTFEEFLIATDNERLLDLIKDSYNDMKEFSLHEKAMELYRTYLVVGGYPAVVKEFIESDIVDYNRIRSIQSNISSAYIADMAKYSTASNTIRTMEIYNTLHAQLAKENSKFQYAIVNSKARAKDYENSLFWLKTANVISDCKRITEGKCPISFYEDNHSFKIYYSDVGLLSLRMDMIPNSIIQNINLSDKARGVLAESYVAQELVAMGISLHYWTSKNTAEVDFVIQMDDSAIPVEVKSSDNVRARSLSVYVKEYHPAYAIRISGKNFGYENGIKSVPLYAVFCINKVE